MKIIIAVGHAGVYSGGAHQALYQVAGFKNAGHEVIAFWGDDIEGKSEGFKRLKELGVPLEILPINRKATRSSVSAFRALLKKYEPDVVECFKSGAQYHALYGGFGLNKHALLFYRGISSPMDVFQGLKYRLSRVDRIIANCSDLRDVMARTGKIPSEKIAVVNGEFDPVCRDPETIDGSGLRKELNIPEDIPLVTNFANWSSWKGWDILIEAVSILKQRGLKFHLLLAGIDTDKMAPEVERRKLTDMVTLSPFRTDPERMLKISTIYVNASTANESLNATMLNAQAMALPIAATRLAGQSDIIEEGVTGFLSDIKDPAGLAGAIGNILVKSPGEIETMGMKAREHAHEKYSSEVRTAKRLSAYEAAIRHRRKQL